jgi:type IV secretory pathway VirD2 relaxase
MHIAPAWKTVEESELAVLIESKARNSVAAYKEQPDWIAEHVGIEQAIRNEVLASSG